MAELKEEDSHTAATATQLPTAAILVTTLEHSVSCTTMIAPVLL